MAQTAIWRHGPPMIARTPWIGSLAATLVVACSSSLTAPLPAAAVGPTSDAAAPDADSLREAGADPVDAPDPTADAAITTQDETWADGKTIAASLVIEKGVTV